MKAQKPPSLFLNYYHFYYFSFPKLSHLVDKCDKGAERVKHLQLLVFRLLIANICL